MIIKYWWNKFYLKVGLIRDKHDLLKKEDSFTNSFFLSYILNTHSCNQGIWSNPNTA